MNANKNRSNGSKLVLKFAMVTITAALALLIVQVVFAYSLGTYQFTNYSVQVDASAPVSPQTWVYRVTVSPTIDSIYYPNPNDPSDRPALSHLALGIDPACVITTTDNDGGFTFFSDEEFTIDGTITVSEAVKFEEGGEVLKAIGDTAVFTITVDNPKGSAQTTYIELKAGNTILDQGTVPGPICTGTTAVDVAEFSAKPNPLSPLVVVGLVFAGTVTTSAVLRNPLKKRDH